MKKITQTPSEKRIFAKMKELEHKLDGIHQYVKYVDRRVGEVERTEQPAAKHPTAKHPTKAEDYVLTDADWQRVVNEKFFVEVCDPRFGKQWHGPCLLTNYSKDKSVRQFAGDRLRWPACRLYTGPNVFIPYFGQGMPVDAKEKVVVRLRDGTVTAHLAGILDWEHHNSSGDIMSYIIKD